MTFGTNSNIGEVSDFVALFFVNIIFCSYIIYKSVFKLDIPFNKLAHAAVRYSHITESFLDSLRININDRDIIKNK